MMAELVNAESVKRVVKSKWFLPALGVGGVIVVLLIVAQRGSTGASVSGTEYPGEVYQPDTEAPVTGAPDISNLESQLLGLFEEFTGGVNQQLETQQGALTEYINAQLEAQQSYIDSFAEGVESAISSIQVPIDPYSGYGAIDPYAGGDYSGYGGEYITTEAYPTEESISSYEPSVTKSDPVEQITKSTQTGASPGAGFGESRIETFEPNVLQSTLTGRVNPEARAQPVFTPDKPRPIVMPVKPPEGQVTPVTGRVNPEARAQPVVTPPKAPPQAPKAPERQVTPVTGRVNPQARAQPVYTPPKAPPQAPKAPERQPQPARPPRQQSGAGRTRVER
jgi:hypothetical protein